MAETEHMALPLKYRPMTFDDVVGQEHVVRTLRHAIEAGRIANAPKSNRAFWNAKFRRNVCRDQEHERLWAEQGWNVIVIWECGLKTAADREGTFAKVADWLQEIEAIPAMKRVLNQKNGTGNGGVDR